MQPSGVVGVREQLARGGRYWLAIRRVWLVLAAALAICLAVLIVYCPLWQALGDSTLLPWGSDTLGHLQRYEFIKQSIQAGDWFPQVMPDWYLGIQLLRYYPPLPYYILYGLDIFLGGSLQALHGFFLLWMLVGGLSWLLFRRWVGWLPAVLGGLAYLLLPDLVRVAFSEGNLPRVMVAGLTPLLLYLVIRALKGEGRRATLLVMALGMLAVTLTHAMLAAVLAVSFGLLALTFWIFRTANLKSALLVISALALGILLSAAWLLPSLSGGITELQSGAVSRGLDAVPWSDLLNPLTRLKNIESVYAGLVLVLTALGVLLIRPFRSRESGAMAVCGLCLSVLSTPQINLLFNALTFSSLLWPTRFLSVAGAFLILALVFSLPRLWSKAPWAAILLAGLVLLDGGISTRLIFLRPVSPAVQHIGQSMAALPGWREATLDESRLGSAPSWLYTSLSGREQVFGWGYQGARTAFNVSSLNDALALGCIGYLLDRLSLFGVDDVVLLDTLPNAKTLAESLSANGYARVEEDAGLSYYHRDGRPRALLVESDTLGIGRGAVNYAYLFPRVLTGSSPYLDDYSLDELTRYRRLILAGFAWHDRLKAEERVRQAALRGVSVFIDMTGIPQDSLSRLPRFLDVWGETVILPLEPLTVEQAGNTIQLEAFGDAGSLWHTFVPQNLEYETATFDYLGKRAALAGYKTYGQGKAWFIGANLAYHALQQKDAAALQFLADLTGLSPDQPADYASVLLQDYATGPLGYAFSVQLDAPQDLLIPVARHDGTQARIDGQPVAVDSLENLILLHAPQGIHQVEIGFRPTWVYTAGLVGSLLGVVTGVWFFLLRAGLRGKGKGGR